MTRAFVDEPLQAFPSVREVWLFGSRANGAERPDSAWDYLIISEDSSLMNRMHQDRRFDRPNIDALVISGEFATRPWPVEDESWKKLRMIDDLEWTPISATLATYRSVKERFLGSFAVELRTLQARRVHPP
jgi:predicted nucleotidyltransferase